MQPRQVGVPERQPHHPTRADQIVDSFHEVARGLARGGSLTGDGVFPGQRLGLDQQGRIQQRVDPRFLSGRQQIGQFPHEPGFEGVVLEVRAVQQGWPGGELHDG